MDKWVRQIHDSVTKSGCEYPIESMLANLIYSFPHPGKKYICKSAFWKGQDKEKSEFCYKYDVFMNQPYCSPYSFKTFAKVFKHENDSFYSILGNMLFNIPVILISEDSKK